MAGSVQHDWKVGTCVVSGIFSGMLLHFVLPLIAGDDEASASTTAEVGVRRRADMACGSKQKMRISGHGEDEFEFVVPSNVLVGKVFYVVVPAPAEPRLAGFVDDSDEEDDEDNEHMAGPAPGDDLARGEALSSSDEDQEEEEQDERDD